MHFGVRIRAERKAAGLSQVQLGKLAQIDSGTISRWETGAEPNPDPSSIEAIAGVLDVRADWIRTGIEPKAPPQPIMVRAGVPMALPQIRALLEAALTRLGELEADLYGVSPTEERSGPSEELSATTPTRGNETPTPEGGENVLAQAAAAQAAVAARGARRKKPQGE